EQKRIVRLPPEASMLLPRHENRTEPAERAPLLRVAPVDVACCRIGQTKGWSRAEGRTHQQTGSGATRERRFVPVADGARGCQQVATTGARLRGAERAVT